MSEARALGRQDANPLTVDSTSNTALDKKWQGGKSKGKSGKTTKRRSDEAHDHDDSESVGKFGCSFVCSLKCQIFLYEGDSFCPNTNEGLVYTVYQNMTVVYIYVTLFKKEDWVWHVGWFTEEVWFQGLSM